MPVGGAPAEEAGPSCSVLQWAVERAVEGPGGRFRWPGRGAALSSPRSTRPSRAEFQRAWHCHDSCPRSAVTRAGAVVAVGSEASSQTLDGNFPPPCQGQRGGRDQHNHDPVRRGGHAGRADLATLEAGRPAGVSRSTSAASRASSSVATGHVVHGGVTTAVLNAVVAADLPGPGSIFLQLDLRFLARCGPATSSPTP